MRLLSLMLCAAALVLASPARADDAHKAECASAYEKSQEFRTQNKLQKAQELLVVCAEASCPTFVQTDCAQWLTEVQKDLPTIIVAAKDKDGADVTAVKVSVDGDVVANELDGKPITIDPGKHKLRFEMEGTAPVEQPIIARQGEKDREIKVSFKPQPKEEVESPYPDAADKAPEQADQGKKGGNSLRIASYVAGGVGVVGLIGFTTFAIMGKGQQSDLEDRGCKPNCPKDEVDSAKSKLLIANISLGVGIAGLGTGVVLFILSQPKNDKPESDAARKPRFDLAALPGGGYATVSGHF